ncbi:MAG: DEAD/DEAH box helicase, partial [Nannocystaceae bacterium]
ETLAVMPTLVYGRPPIARVDGDNLTLLGGGLPKRDSQAERSLASRLHAELGLIPGQRTVSAGAAAVEMMAKVRRFRGADISGEGPTTFFRSRTLLPDLRVEARDFNLRFVSEGAVEGEGFDDAVAPEPTGLGNMADPQRVLQAWRDGEDLVPLTGGGWAPLPVDWLEKYGNQIAFLLAARDGGGAMQQYAAPALVELCADLDMPISPELDALRNMIEDFTGIGTSPLPDDLQAELRDYQRHGVNWLGFMRRAKLGAMLADDMGLGKTVQALCVIDGRTLIVAPTSVLHNWAAELAKFRPSLTVGIYHGSRRKLDPKIDVTLTTYAILRLDIATLSDIEWDMVALDEAQMIKNSDSQVARAAFRLKARFRATLTGTPVENRLEELWSQMHFLNPGLLGGRSDFTSTYARPISDGVPGVAKQLRKRIRPFLLRRRKQEVARELPPRTDVVLRCQLTKDERKIYEAIRAATHQEVVERLKTGGNVLQALEALLRLRQAACHTGLIPGQASEAGATSAKLSLLLATLDEVVAEGHR